ncbi:MAG: Rieske 2Fe-2S domain-containing protein [Alphaproteobacteria bacterium]|nr:Rieske 2Fe-2S domain-containing protein [Alphaproteobacteria bacterium]
MNIENPEALKPGEARCPGASTRDVVNGDGCRLPEPLLAENYEFLGDGDLPVDRYVSRDFFDAEMKKLWPKVWQWACRDEHIPEVGDYYAYDIGPYSILVVRVAEDEVKAYHNSCLHRGTQLRPSDSTGNVPHFRCPFHGWTWNLDGSLKEIPCRWDFPHVSDAEFSLPEVHVAKWGGFYFVNMDDDPVPLEEYLGPLARHFETWPLADRYVRLHIQKILPANWKAAQEAFLEAYHSMETHSHIMAYSANLNAQYDVFSERVSRFYHTFGFPDPSWTEPLTEQEILDRTGMVPPGSTVPPGGTARSVMAAHMRKVLGEERGIDLSERSDSEMLDSIEYHLFPNMFLFPGIALPMIYRFRPNGMDPDSAIFDLLFLEQLAPGQQRPEAPEPHRIDIGTSYETVPGIGSFLGHIYDQDTGNLEMQQRGFKAARKRGETLGNYQEVRIRRLHQTLDSYLNA